ITVVVLVVIVTQGVWVFQKLETAFAVERQPFSSNLIETMPKSYPRRDISAGDFRLTDQNGEMISLSEISSAGNTTILSFAFANCRTICPAIVYHVTEARKQLGGDVRL